MLNRRLWFRLRAPSTTARTRYRCTLGRSGLGLRSRKRGNWPATRTLSKPPNVHSGMEDRAEALGNLPARRIYASVELSGFGAAIWFRSFHRITATTTLMMGRKIDKTPWGKGVLSWGVTDFQELSVDVRSGGGGNCTRVPRSFDNGLYVRSRSFDVSASRPRSARSPSAYPVMNLTQAATGG